MDKEKLPSLVAKAQEGDNQALNDLFTETYNDVYYFALKTVKDETLAADITQETFVTIFKNINSLNDNVAYPAWSRQITYRCCLQYLKKQNRETTVDENEDGSTIFDTVQEDREDFIPDKNLDKEDFKKTILDIVDSLPEEQRTAVILYYYDELSVKQIAEIQGVTEGTVKSRLNYARKAIKSSVETYEKKNNIKLHSVGILPLLMWLFGTDAKACSMPAQTVQTVASGVSATTGTTISVSKLVQVSSKLLGAMWQKIVAGLVAVAIAIGGTVAVVNFVDKPDTTDTTDTTDTSDTSDIQVSQDKGPTIAVGQGRTIIQQWEGMGKVNTELYSSDENNLFCIDLFKINETSIHGYIQIYISKNRLYSIEFQGSGRNDENTNSILYDIQLNEETNRYPVVAGCREMTLRYDTEKGTLDFVSGPYDVTLKKVN